MEKDRHEQETFTPTFREEVGILDKKGQREWMYPKAVDGWYYKARTVVGILLLVVLFAGPFLTINGHPLLLLNVLERRFILFGVAFFPEDFYLLALCMLTFVVFVVLFTVVFGRVFCGWTCPQTVFMEMVFRRIEYWIEGDANNRRRLDAQGWTTEKIWKKTLKHTIFFLISFWIANTFLAYLIGIDDLKKLIEETPAQHLGTFVALIIFTGVFYAVFAFLREIVCVVICPYGRLQGVLLDNNSTVVAYDFVRGEPRGKIRKNETRTHGDCVDCTLCVQVCPTGIDIRNGTQLECINCTACMDVCDDVMDKIHRPKGLIRYASMKNIQEGKKFKFTTRMKAYTALLVVLLSVVVGLLVTRKTLEITILRTPGTLFQQTDAQTISNLYNLELANKNFTDMPLELRLKNTKGRIRMVGTGNTLRVPSQQVTKAVFFIDIPTSEIKENTMKVDIQAFSDGKLMGEIKTSFLGPVE